MTDRRKMLRKKAAERSRKRRSAASATMSTAQLLDAMKQRDASKNSNGTVGEFRVNYRCPICKDRGGWIGSNGCPSCGMPPAS